MRILNSLFSVAPANRQYGKLLVIGLLIAVAFTFLGWESKIGKIGKSAVPGQKTFKMTSFTLEQPNIGTRTFGLVYNDNRISRINLLDENGNFVETQYLFEYDENGNLIKHISSYAEKQKIITYNYDKNGLLISKAISNQRDDEGVRFKYTYDQADQLIAENNLSKDGDVVQETSFSYADRYQISSTTTFADDYQDKEEYHFSEELGIPKSFTNFYYTFFTPPQFKQFNNNLLEKYVGDFGPESEGPETCRFQYEVDENGNVIRQAYLFNGNITDIHTYTYEEI